ncbi:MAG: MarR family transcriptional regulator [Gammaproteobacteria bacterium]|nr:MarR family transcriptional regulator [Gammaproteobacteria bacterium]
MSRKVLTDIEYLICDVSTLWRKASSNAAKKLGLTNIERRVLAAVARLETPTQIEIARYTDSEPQNLMRVIDKLEQKGLVQRGVCDEDRRAKRICLTTDGSELVQKIVELGDQLRPHILSKVSQQQQQQIREHLTTLKVNLIQHLDGKKTDSSLS